MWPAYLKSNWWGRFFEEKLKTRCARKWKQNWQWRKWRTQPKASELSLNSKYDDKWRQNTCKPCLTHFIANYRDQINKRRRRKEKVFYQINEVGHNSIECRSRGRMLQVASTAAWGNSRVMCLIWRAFGRQNGHMRENWVRKPKICAPAPIHGPLSLDLINARSLLPQWSLRGELGRNIRRVKVTD